MTFSREKNVTQLEQILILPWRISRGKGETETNNSRELKEATQLSFTTTFPGLAHVEQEWEGGAVLLNSAFKGIIVVRDKPQCVYVTGQKKKKITSY